MRGWCVNAVKGECDSEYLMIQFILSGCMRTMCLVRSAAVSCWHLMLLRAVNEAFTCCGTHYRRLSKLGATGCRAPSDPLGAEPVFEGMGCPLKVVGEAGVPPPHMNPGSGFTALWASVWLPAGGVVKPIGAHAAILPGAAGPGPAGGAPHWFPKGPPWSQGVAVGE